MVCGGGCVARGGWRRDEPRHPGEHVLRGQPGSDRGVDSLPRVEHLAPGGARDLELFVRIAVPAKNSRVPLERKFGVTGQKAARLLVKTRQAADELGITFHVGSQTTTPDAYHPRR